MSQQLVSSLSKTNNVVSTTLHQSISNHTTNNKYNAESDGLDYLQVKNGIMLSYLIDLTMLLKYRFGGSSSSNSSGSGSNTDQAQKECLTRLLEMRTILIKIRPLEKKLRYQIDKLLALSTLGAGMFAARNEEQDDDEKKKQNEESTAEQLNNSSNSADPLSFKPDLQGMMKMFEEDAENNDGDSNEESDEDNTSDEEDDETSAYKPKIALEKEDKDTDVYQPPRLQSVPFELDNERALLKQERLLQKQRDRLSRSELTQVIKSQFTDAPEEEDIRGGALLGKQSEASRKIAQRDATIQEFEESQMIRLTMGKAEKKQRKKMIRDELSNLNVLSSGLGNVVAGVDEAFGNDNEGDDNDDIEDIGGGRRSKRRSGDRYRGGDDGDGSFKTKGMRKRKVEVLDGSRGGVKKHQSKKKKKGASNTYQKSLYGR